MRGVKGCPAGNCGGLFPRRRTRWVRHHGTGMQETPVFCIKFSDDMYSLDISVTSLGDTPPMAGNSVTAATSNGKSMSQSHQLFNGVSWRALPPRAGSKAQRAGAANGQFLHHAATYDPKRTTFRDIIQRFQPRTPIPTDVQHPTSDWQRPQTRGNPYTPTSVEGSPTAASWQSPWTRHQKYHPSLSACVPPAGKTRRRIGNNHGQQANPRTS